MITINLLPEDIRENVAYSKKNRNLLKYIRIVIIVCLLFLSSFAVLYFFLFTSNNFFLKDIKESEAVIKKDQGVLDEAKAMKSRIKIIEKIKKDYKYWSKLDYILNRTTPVGIKTVSLEFDERNASTTKESTSNVNKMKLVGYAKTKNDVGIYRDALAQQSGFKTINIESIIEETPDAGGILNKFTISFTIEEATLKKDKK